MTTAVLPPTPACRIARRDPTASHHAAPVPPLHEQQARARRLLATEMAFFADADFDRLRCEDMLDQGLVQPPKLSATPVGKLPRGLPGHLARMCEAELLTPDEEQDLFRRMNYLKFRANQLRATLDPERPDAKAIDEAERLLTAAQAVRDRIVEANMRLVMAVVKKYVTPRHSFDDLLSEGMMTLMTVVEKFDYRRGFRFCTYAYRAISRNTYRAILDQHKEASRYSDVDDDVFHTEARGASLMDERAWESLRGALGQMLNRLDRRERFILCGRYALGAHRKTHTFQALADKLGLSKERVRQLEQRAVAKLRAMAAEWNMGDLLDLPATQG